MFECAGSGFKGIPKQKNKKERKKEKIYIKHWRRNYHTFNSVTISFLIGRKRTVNF